MRIEVKFEKLADLLADGLEDMLADDYEEIEHDTERFPLSVDWPSAMALERQGQFRPIGARRDGELVGYSAFQVIRHFHSQRSLAAFNDVVYVRPQERGRCGVALIRRSEALLRGLGVERIFYTVKVDTPTRIGALLAKLGYVHQENVFGKVL